MKRIGAYEAKSSLSKLLAQVKNGESFTITLNGAPVAVLSPAHEAKVQDIRKAVERWKKNRKGLKLGSDNLKAMIEEGRS